MSATPRSDVTAAERTQAAAGKTTKEVVQQHGGDRRSEKAISRTESVLETRKQRAEENGVSMDTQAKLDALARQAPELLAKVQAGEMSCHRACVEAGIVREPTPVERIEREFRRLGRRVRQQVLQRLRDITEGVN
jgi:hypothetical protein